ncbi:MAG: zinc ribbon domain-containing protein [Ramlibacter sp.]
MLSEQIRSSGSLLDNVDAIRNWRAMLVLLATMVATALLFAIGGLLAGVTLALLGLFVLAGYAVLFYGANACGMMMMDEARGQPSRPPMDAVRQSLATSHRLILVFLLLGVLYLAGFLVLAIVLAICKIPFLGPVLYAVVFPVAVVVFGIAMFALPTVVFPLSAPSVWNGATTMQCVSQLLAIARKRLLLVLMLMIAVAFIAGFVALLIGAILFTGTAVTAMLSVPILGMGGGMGGFGGMLGGMMGGAGMGRGIGMSGIPGHAIGAMLGGGILFAIAFTLPGMVYLRGACSVYLRAIDGLDLAAEQAAIDARLAAAAARAREVQARAMAPAPVAATAAAAEPMKREPVLDDRPFAASTPPVNEPANARLAPVCPKCGAGVSASDVFCGECGHRL